MYVITHTLSPVSLSPTNPLFTLLTPPPLSPPPKKKEKPPSADLDGTTTDTTGGNPNDNSLCGKKIQITMGDGSTAEVTVADRCEACAEWDLDLTPTTFQSIVTGGLDEGRTTASWVFVD